MGKFSFWYPADWNVKNCDNGNGMPYVVATFAPPSTPCNGEEYDARFMLQSTPGSQTPAPYNTQYIAKTASMTATVNGVNGIRETFHYMTSPALPPPKGTDLVTYVFLTAGRTYVVEYFHYPGEPDRTVDFDTLVNDTLRFT